MALVYELKFPSGKKYIGVTSRTLEQRINEHVKLVDKRRYDKTKLQRAIKKYGIDSIQSRVISETETYDQALALERVFIESYDTKVNGYNITDGGEGVVGRVRSEEELARISKAQHTRFEKAEEREHTSQTVKKYIEQNPEKVATHSKRRQEVVQSPEHSAKMSEIMKESFKNNPEFGEEQGKRMKTLMSERPELRTQISRALGGTPIEVYRDNVLIDVCVTRNEASRKYNASAGNIGMVLSGRRTHTKGLTFKRSSDA